MNSMKKLLEANVAYGRRRISQVFRDFCEISALAIRNSVDPVGHDGREARYAEITKGYTPEELDRFAQVLAGLTLELEAGLSDALGHLYMSLDLGNERLGQFFTPFSVGQLMAKLTVGKMLGALAQQPFVTVHEPACGSGGMLIALAGALRESGVNYQRQLHAVAVDLDITAVHMTYVQLSLLHIPATVIHGNTLTLEQRDVWPTPAHVLGRWHARLRHREAVQTVLGPEAKRLSPVVNLSAPETDEADVAYIGPQTLEIEGIA